MIIQNVLNNPDILLYINEFIDIEDSQNMMRYPVNKLLFKISENKLLNIKKNTLIYKFFLNKTKTDQELNKIPILFFKMTFFRKHFRDFKKYIFYILDIINNDCFLLISKLRKIYYVKRYDYNTAYLVYYYSSSINNNIYFNRFENKIKINNTGNHQQCGHFLKNDEIIEEHKELIKKLF